MLRAAALILLPLTASCATGQMVARSDPRGPEWVQSVADHVKRCYRTPKIGRAARQISTRLRVRYAADGTLLGLPTIVSQSGLTDRTAPLAPHMAEAATMAIVRCGPISLPPEAYQGGWNDLELTFSPTARA